MFACVGEDPSSPLFIVDERRQVDATCTDPGAPQCGPHGTCNDATGTRVCECAAGYAGADCSMCAKGYEDHDGTCEPACEPKCGAHASCVTTDTTAECRCTIGYTAEGGVCTWTGGPRDPELEAPAASSPWHVAGGTLDPDAPGKDGKGLFIVPREVLCAGAPGTATNASLAQTFQMPSVSEGEPFALEVVGRYYCADANGANLASCTYGRASYETVFSYPGTAFVPGLAWTKQEFCLGEKAYGDSVRLALETIRTNGHPGVCDPNVGGRRELQIDSVRIAPSNRCPAVGTIVNGDFDADGDWYTVGSASVEPGIGSKGSRAGSMVATEPCPTASPSLTSAISVPDVTVPSPALTFQFKGSTDRLLAVAVGLELDYSEPPIIRGNGTYQSISMCLPEYAKGYVVPLTLLMNNEEDCSATIPQRQLIIDDLKVASRPDQCGAHVFIQDGGFENGLSFDGTSHWRFSSEAGPPLRSSALVARTPGAHSGAGFARLVQYRTCSPASARTLITVPRANGSNGPAVKFFYKRSATGSAPTIEYTLKSLTDSGSPGAVASLTQVSDTWVEGKLCLPPGDALRAGALVFTLGGSDPTCGQDLSNAPASLAIDDVTVTTDADCTAN